MKSAITKVAVPIAVLSTLHGCTTSDEEPQQDASRALDEKTTTSHTHSTAHQHHSHSKSHRSKSQQPVEENPIVEEIKEQVNEVATNAIKSAVDTLEDNIPDADLKATLETASNVVREEVAGTQNLSLNDKVTHALANKKVQAVVTTVGLALVGFFARRHLINFVNKMLGRPTESTEPSLGDDMKEIVEDVKEVVGGKKAAAKKAPAAKKPAAKKAAPAAKKATAAKKGGKKGGK